MNKKRNVSNIRKAVVKNGQLAPLQLGNQNGRSGLNGHKSAAPLRMTDKKGSDFVHVYTTSLPLTLKLREHHGYNAAGTLTSSKKMASTSRDALIPAPNPTGILARGITTRQSDLSLREMSVREGESFSQD